jgi:hypothetical protein
VSLLHDKEDQRSFGVRVPFSFGGDDRTSFCDVLIVFSVLCVMCNGVVPTIRYSGSYFQALKVQNINDQSKRSTTKMASFNPKTQVQMKAQ